MFFKRLIMTQLNIAITGASGYIGSQFVSKLKSCGHHITALGRAKVSLADTNINFTIGEEISLNNIDVLIHCAHDFQPTNYDSNRKINFEGSVKLFEKARICGVKNIIFISTTSAFEGAISNYGRIKYETENYVRSLGGTVVRAGLVFGKNSNGISGGIVGALNNFVKNFPFAPLVGEGKQIFYPCHLNDLSELISYLVTYSNLEPNLPIIAASEDSLTFKEIILTIAKKYNKKIITIPIPYFALFSGLFFAELLNLKMGLRSDSLRYMKQTNHNMDFNFIRNHQILFRPFTVDNLN